MIDIRLSVMIEPNINTNAMERTLTRTHKIILVFFVILLMVGGVFRLYQAGIIGKHGTKKDITIIREEPPIKVHVKGAVRNPNVYTLKPGSRWGDAVDAAGGFDPSADKEGVNLAAFLRDGQEIYIPRIKNTATYYKKTKLKPGEMVNINTASAEELEKIPGIGPVTAGRIVESRKRRGPFRRIEEITLVSGIGKQKFLRMKRYLSVGEKSK